jgi:hypothetical protein
MEDNIGMSVTEVISETVEATAASTDTVDNGIVGIAVGIGVTVVACGIALWVNRDKIKAYRKNRKAEKAKRRMTKDGTIEAEAYVIHEDGSVEEI